jgi:hypothetical protein
MTEVVDKRTLARKALCALQLCQTFRTQEDEFGIWGECERCGRRAGYMSRAELRAVGDRAIAAHDREKAEAKEAAQVARAKRDRPALNPGGMLCDACGEVFIGEEWHKLCAQCLDMAAQDSQDVVETAEAEVAARAARWHWRNCRSIGLRFDFWLWPWGLHTYREDDVYGGEMWAMVGPLGFGLAYSIGNASSEGWDRHTALSEGEAYDRAERWETGTKGGADG